MQTEDMSLNYTVKLTETTIDREEISFTLKRNLLFSLYCFRSIFDNLFQISIDPILKKYGVVFEFPVDHPFFSDLEVFDESAVYDGGVSLIVEPNKSCFKLDSAGTRFYAAVKEGLIEKEFRAPCELMSLYEVIEMVTRLNNTTDELKAMWYQMFPYVVLIETPHEPDLFDKFAPVLNTPEVYTKVLESRYSLSIPAAVEEMWAAEMPTLIIDWYLPYILFINEKDEHGLSRQVKFLQKELARGKFAEVIALSDKLLNVYPDDENLLLSYISARVSLSGQGSEKQKQKFLAETLEIIEDAMSVKRKKQKYFLFYRGLTRLGLMQTEKAKEDFLESLKIDDKFEMAMVMLKGMEKHEKSV